MLRDAILWTLLFTPFCLSCRPTIGPSDLSTAQRGRPDRDWEALFNRQSGWTGADGVYSVALSDDTLLWLFSDTWVGEIRDGKHVKSRLVNNSVALQRGRRPESGETTFFWGPSVDGSPTAFLIPEDQVGWFWVMDGVLSGDRLILFLMQMIKTDEPSVFGFQMVGTWIAEVANPLDSPSLWRVTQHKSPFGEYSKTGNTYWGSSLLREKDLLYVFGCRENWKEGIRGRHAVVARAPIAEILHFESWQFQADGKWQEDWPKASSLFPGVAAEYSVCHIPGTNRMAAVYTENGMSSRIMMRESVSPVGPWGPEELIYDCPDQKWDPAYFCYAARAHPELSTESELLITYVCNSTDFWKMVGDSRIYRPRFVRVRLEP